jgi:DUF4097 and DUF4098 domain-containing protein YvlB
MTARAIAQARIQVDVETIVKLPGRMASTSGRVLSLCIASKTWALLTYGLTCLMHAAGRARRARALATITFAMDITRARLYRLALPSLILTAALLSRPAGAAEYVKTYPIAHRADVRVSADESSVRVSTSDTNQVEFRVRSEGFATLEIGGDIHVESHQDGDNVMLTVKVRNGVTIGINTKHIKTEVRMPRNADLWIDTSDGAVELESVDGNITVRSKDGAIKASQLTGHIELTSTDGSLTADSLKGEARLHTTDGSIVARDLDGKLQAATSDGSVRVDGRFDALDARSLDGSVSVRIAPGSRMSSPWNVRSKDGSVNVSLPRDLQANIDARTNGHINSDLPVAVHGDLGKSRVEGTINGGGPLLTVRSLDGSIHLTASD